MTATGWHGGVVLEVHLARRPARKAGPWTGGESRGHPDPVPSGIRAHPRVIVGGGIPYLRPRPHVGMGCTSRAGWLGRKVVTKAKPNPGMELPAPAGLQDDCARSSLIGSRRGWQVGRKARQRTGGASGSLKHRQRRLRRSREWHIGQQGRTAPLPCSGRLWLDRSSDGASWHLAAGVMVVVRRVVIGHRTSECAMTGRPRLTRHARKGAGDGRYAPRGDAPENGRLSLHASLW